MGIIVTVLVLIRVTILQTGSKLLKCHKLELLYFRSGYIGLQSITMTSNFGRAVTILPTLLLRPGRSLQSILDIYGLLAERLTLLLVCNSS